jgi:PAS domain S-box-containing protein
MRRSPKPPREKDVGRGDVAALLDATRAVLKNRSFADAANEILLACKTTLLADTGALALCAKGAKVVEITLHEPGAFELDLAAGFPEPVRRLQRRAYRLRRTAFANDLSSTKRAASGRPSVAECALIAPLVIDGDVTGLICLINKPGGFSAADSQLAEVFAELTAVAMLRSRTVSRLEARRNALAREVREGAAQLRQAEESWKTLVENLPDIIARFDPEQRHLYVSPAIERVLGLPPEFLIGKASRELGLEPELVEPWEAVLRKVLATAEPATIERAVPGPDGTRYFDCRLVPEFGPGGVVRSVLSVARDVTEASLAHEAERRARAVAETLREATIALTRSLDRETVLATLLDRLRRIVPFDRGSVMLMEEASRVSVRAVYDGGRVVRPTPEGRPELDVTTHPILREVLETASAVVIPDVRARPDWTLEVDRSSEASWMGVPLFARGDVVGLFSLSKREPGYFNDEHVRLAEAMASQASVAVENAVLFEQMQASSLQMQSLSRRLVEVQEGERRRIARELHDEAGQALASLRYGLRLLEKKISKNGPAIQQVAELMRRTDTVIDGLHRLAADLRPASLDQVGLEAALRQYVRAAESQFGHGARFKSRGFNSDRLPTVIETALYRVVQEAMTNVVRHAQATRVDVLLERRGERVTVMIEDDGVGFMPDRVQREGHFGLLGVKERAEVLGGTLTVESAPGAGTTVVVEVPCADPHPDR